MANLFAKKKAEAPKSTAKKDDKIVVTVPGDEFAKNLKRFNELKGTITNLTAELKSLEGDIKGEGVEKFIELYEKGKRNPGSFKLASEDGDKVMVIAMDKYLKLDEERANELKADYGDELVEETTTFAFNNTLLDKYQEQISELIMNAGFMTEDEKDNLIEPTTTLNVKKGAINEAMTLGKGEVADFLGAIAPILALKQTR